MGDNDLMEQILLQVQADMQLVKIGQSEIRTDIANIKVEIDELKCEDEGRDLLGVVRIIQAYPKVASIMTLVLLFGLVVSGSTVLARFGLEEIMDEVEARYMTGPRMGEAPKEYRDGSQNQ